MDRFLIQPKLKRFKRLLSWWVETNVNRNQAYFKSLQIWDLGESSICTLACVVCKNSSVGEMKDKMIIMCDDRDLTVWALGQRNLLDLCAISAGKDLHLTLVLVELPIRPTDGIAIVTAVPVARAPLKPLLLQAAKHIVALVGLHKTCSNAIFH